MLELKMGGPRKVLLIFAGVHLTVWTLLPTLLYHTPPVDVVEGIIWGQQWSWGYDKHPWLAPWLTAAASFLGGDSTWSIYLLSQVSVLLCGFATWRLASRMLPPAHAAISVLLLEAIYFYTFPTPEFNPNVAMLPVWALSTLVFYRALETQHIRMWLLLGVLAGLAMMAKYFSAILLVTQFLFLLTNPAARSSFKRPGPYLAGLLCVLVMLPNFLWVLQHQFAAVEHAFSRPKDPGTLYHLMRPLQFAGHQLVALFPFFLVFIPCFLGEKKPQPLSSFNRQFIDWFALVPVLLTSLVSLVTSMRLRSIYGMPLFIFAGMFLVARVSPVLTPIQFNKTIRNIWIAFSLSALALIISIHLGPPLKTHESKHANFPGPEIAKRLTEEWRARYHCPLRYVAGEHWLSGSVAFYSPDHPTAYFYWNPKVSFWVDENHLQQKGAVFIWNATKLGSELPAELPQRFSRIIQLPTEEFKAPFVAFPNPMPPTKLGIAFLPPLTR